MEPAPAKGPAPAWASIAIWHAQACIRQHCAARSPISRCSPRWAPCWGAGRWSVNIENVGYHIPIATFPPGRGRPDRPYTDPAFGFRAAVRYCCGRVRFLSDAARHDIADAHRRLRRALVAFFARRTGSPAEAEDLTQEVFVRIARAPQAEAPLADAYIFRIAANLLRDKGRRDRVRASYREARALEDFLGVDPLDPHRIAEDQEDLRIVAQAIAELPEKTRRVFTLYRIENIDKRAIAEGFGLSVRMVEIHIQRALATLTERLEKGR